MVGGRSSWSIGRGFGRRWGAEEEGEGKGGCEDRLV